MTCEINCSTQFMKDFHIFGGRVEDAVETIVSWIETTETPKYLVCVNPHSALESIKNKELRISIQLADLVIPDGIGVVYAMRLLGFDVQERITGSDIFYQLLTRLNTEGGASVFFLGSTIQTLQFIRNKLNLDFPKLTVVGTYSPPYKDRFDDDDRRDMIKIINDQKPDVLWVGMTAPKQEIWIHQNKDKLNVRFIGAVGAVFDFYAGNIRRAPVWMQKLGLEWLYRWIREPRRLWKRNLVSTPKFVIMVLKERFKRQ